MLPAASAQAAAAEVCIHRLTPGRQIQYNAASKFSLPPEPPSAC
jgi:hypothetical protein